MKIFDKIIPLQAEIQAYKTAGKRLGFVPTMGALHPGHLELAKRALAENDIVVVSIFVNPTQFNNPGDLSNYPRTLDTDLRQLKEAGVHLVFTPSVEEVYPQGDAASAELPDPGALATVMEGKFRPGHFKGVMQVVARLFSIVEPDRACFGEKDFQQLAIIRFMTNNMHLPVEIVPCPTVRENDGLAMSSRNLLLTPEERAEAPVLYKTLSFVRNAWRGIPLEHIKTEAVRRIEKNGLLKVEYLEIAGEDDLQPVRDWNERSRLRCFVAAHIGRVRLIDNIAIHTGSA